MSFLIINSNIVSTASLHHSDYVSHGGWASGGSHKYIKRLGSPGNWRYIYPENLSRLRSARNNSDATLFGNRQLASRVRSADRATRRLQRAENRYTRRAQRLERKSADIGFLLRDPTIQGRKRDRLSKKASKIYASSQAAMAMARKISEARLSVSETARVSRIAYDRTRKIDDIPKNILETGAAYVNALRRKARLQKMQQRDQRAAQGRISKPFRGLIREQKIYEQRIPERYN